MDNISCNRNTSNARPLTFATIRVLYEIIYFSILSFTSVTVGLALLMFKARTFESLLEQSFIELIFTTMGHPCKCVFVSSYNIEGFNGINHIVIPIC